MSYIKSRIEKNKLADEVYCKAFDEEVELLAREQARREELMKRVAAVRKAKHLTQQEMADAMSISQARVSQLERGAEPLSVDSFLQMLEVLDLHLVILTDDEARQHGLDHAAGKRLNTSVITRHIQATGHTIATAETRASYYQTTKSPRKKTGKS